MAAPVDGRGCIFLAGLERAERCTAERLVRLAQGSPPWPPIAAEPAIAQVERQVGMPLAASQRDAVRLELAANMLVITGGPSAGKAMLARTLFALLRARTRTVALAAPTDQVAKWLSEAAGLEAA